VSEKSQFSLEILRRREVQARTGLSRSTIYERVRAKTFPLPISLGSQSVGWLKSEIDEWIAERVKLSRGPAAAAEQRKNIET
jgi:prophage regulatory protein